MPKGKKLPINEYIEQAFEQNKDVIIPAGTDFFKQDHYDAEKVKAAFFEKALGNLEDPIIMKMALEEKRKAKKEGKEFDMLDYIKSIDTEQFKYTKQYISEKINKTLNSKAFKGSKVQDIENLIAQLKEDDAWETFRKYNRHQKVILDNFMRVAAEPNTDEQKRWKYVNGGHAGKTIYIALCYDHDNGDSYWHIWEA